MQNEMKGKMFDPIHRGEPPVSGHDVNYVMFDVKHRSKWLNLGILYIMAVGYRVIFFLLLKGRENLFPTIASKTYKTWVDLRTKIVPPSLFSKSSPHTPDTQTASREIVVAQ